MADPSLADPPPAAAAATPASSARAADAPPPKALTAAAAKKAERAAQRKRVARLSSAKPAPKPKKPFALVVGSGSIVSVVAMMLLLLAWGVGMTLVVVFGDKMSVRLMAQYSEMQDAYERNVQLYREEAARLFEEQQKDKVDKDSVLERVEDLLRRQRRIESRQTLLDKLINQVGVDAASAPASGGAAPPTVIEAPIPPVRPGFPTRTRGDAGGSSFDRLAGIDPPPLARLATVANETAEAPPLVLAQGLEPPPDPPPLESIVEEQVGRIDRAMRAADATQIRQLNGIVRFSGRRLEHFRNALGVLGLTPETAAPDNGRTSANVAIIPVPLAEQKGPFEAGIKHINANAALLYRIRPAVAAMPIARPTTTEARFASPFGYRIHPISHVRKLHAGLDLAFAIGTPIRAAGSGVVLSAGWGGGYGNLVQIDHGNGVVSRYAHMSAIEVAQGQPVSVGSIVGKMGSTGASTGSHLHFETRIKGAPSNPACFLIAGDRLREAQSPGFVCDKAPFGQESASSEDEDDDS